MSSVDDERYPSPGPGRVPPSDLTAEEHLLGAIMLNERVFSDVIQIVRSEDFFRGANRKIFETFEDLHNRGIPIEPISVIEMLKQKKALTSVGDELAVFNLVNNVATSANATFYAELIAKAATRRQLISAGGQIAEIGFDPSLDELDAIDQAQAVLYEIGRNKSAKDFETLGSLVKEALHHLDAHSGNEDGLLGISTGFSELDKLTSGLRGGQLIIIAARPAMGKSTLATNIAHHVAANLKLPVAMFSLEMGANEIVLRIVSAHANIYHHRLQKPSEMSRLDWVEMSKAVSTFANLPFYIDDTPGINVMSIRTKCRRLAEESGGLGLVVVDYLQLMESYKRSEGRVQEVAEFSRGLKILAKELDVPVIALSQLSRKPEERTDRRPLLSDLRESGSIEQDADIVMFIYRDEVYKKPDDLSQRGKAELIVAKHRAGQLATIDLTFKGQFSRFSDPDPSQMAGSMAPGSDGLAPVSTPAMPDGNYQTPPSPSPLDVI